MCSELQQYFLIRVKCCDVRLVWTSAPHDTQTAVKYRIEVSWNDGNMGFGTQQLSQSSHHSVTLTAALVSDTGVIAVLVRDEINEVYNEQKCFTKNVNMTLCGIKMLSE